jgi:acyl-coenzyme A synthetase/AMP-(fatty) acid ligase
MNAFLNEPALPLLCATDMDSVFARHGGRDVTRREFLGSVVQLAQRLPDKPYLLNLCDNRYLFTIAFAAGCARAQTNLLPPNRTPATLDDIRARFANHHALDDALVSSLATHPNHASAQPIPAVRADHVAAIVFTSGSTGAPQANHKLWRTLVGVAEQEAERLFPPRSQVVATVPAQHMYGFEATTLLALGSECSIHDGKPLFPADVRAALAEIPEPRVLVTTPWHLQICVRSGVQLPALHAVISATAPLEIPLAQEVESRWQTRVYEIYGCTEAGSMASRRTAMTDVWQAYASGRYWQDQGVSYYQGAHLPDPVPLQDRLAIVDAEHVRLIGRATDIVKVSGKRASLGELTQHLLSINGVLDGVIFQPEPDQRTAALVVAPNATAQNVVEALAAKIDPAFVPRPLLIVDRLPRNELGKLPLAELHELLNRTRQ